MVSCTENPIEIFPETMSIVDINLGITAIFTILGFPTYKYDIYFYLNYIYLGLFLNLSVVFYNFLY